MIAGVIILGLSIAAMMSTYGDVTDSLDPSQNHIIELEGGENETVNLSKHSSYLLFRQTDSSCNCNVSEVRTQTDVSITSPSFLQSDREGNDGVWYYAVGAFQPDGSGAHDVQNSADTGETLWVIDEMNMGGDSNSMWIFQGACVGVICGICLLPISLVMWRKWLPGMKTQPAGLVMQTAGGSLVPITPHEGVEQQRIPTTDEIWRSVHGGESLNLVIEETHPPENDVPAPFADRPDRVGGVSRVVDEIESVEESAIEDVVEDGDPNERNWKVWDEG
jgi:hypothetical protein